jgi:glycosyltransferase involved in cell wall biosynthesis
VVDSDTQQSSSRELITVGIPCYNRREPTRRAVLSVLGQNYAPLRLVVSDNASDDGTADMLQSLSDEHHELVPLLHDRNSGPTVNFQRLRDHVDAGYFMWLGDDDWLGEGVLAACA